MLLTTIPLVHVCTQALQCPPAPATAAVCDSWFSQAEQIGGHLVEAVAAAKGISNLDALSELLACLIVYSYEIDDKTENTLDKQPDGSFKKALKLADNRISTVGCSTTNALQ